jgi:ABC-type phosphate transport system auxiliary subunit
MVIGNLKMTTKKNQLTNYELSWRADIEAEQSRIEAEMQAKQAKLDSAKAKLAALGLDEEEVAAIVGGI